MKKTLLFLFCFSLTLCAWAQQKSELFIFSVGVKNYQDPTLNLQFADKDAIDLAEAWKKQNTLYDVQEVKVLVNAQATRNAIRTEFDNFAKKVTANDLFVFIFSGHGIEENLVPYDFNRNDTYASALNKADLVSKLKKLGCNTVILLDACHSGSFAKSINGKDIDEGAFNLSVEQASQQLHEALHSKDKTSLLMTSSSSDQLSYECSNCQHGYFAQTVLDAFNGKEVIDTRNKRKYVPNRDGDVNGFISVSELENYVYEAVRINSAVEGSTQKVRILKSAGADFPLIQSVTKYTIPGPGPKPKSDQDADGIPDSEDTCPDRYGTRANKGCPTESQGSDDYDNDGFPDSNDSCPYESGTANGCPDADRDGVPDKSDKCKNTFGKPEYEGCPDSDNDDIPDHKDNCPREKGTRTYNGCPPPVETFNDFTETHDGLNVKMVAVKGGSFQMGSENGSSDEKPIHQVSVSDFHIGRYEITQKQWRAIMGTDPSYFKNCDDCPVEQVSWNDVQDFLTKLNSKTGKKYRLPTEAEWEYAARGGNKSNGYTYSGSNTIGDVAQYEGNNNKSTKSVGSKNANELGIYDMSGNVWEWCSDWYDSSYYKNSPSSNPGGASSGSYRVDRGGSWYFNSGYCRVAYRSGNAPGNRVGNLGFRVILSSENN